MSDDGMVSVPLSWSEQHEKVKNERDRLRVRAAAVQRAFLAANTDRRYAWQELRRENELHVEAKIERDRLRAAFEGVQALLDERTDRWAHAIAERDTAEAERDRLRAEKAHLVEVNAVLRTRPDLAERAPLVMALAEERDAARNAADQLAADRLVDNAERDRLRAIVEVVREWQEAFTAFNDTGGHAAGDRAVAAGKALAALDVSGVMGGSPESDLPYDAAAEHDYAMDLLARLTAAEAERDRLGAVVDAARRWYQASDMDELQHAVTGLKAALRQLDGTEITGAGSEADDPMTAEQLRQFHADTDDLYREAQHESYVQAERSAIPVFPLLANLMDLRDFVRHPDIVGPRLIEWWNRALPAGLGPWLETVVREALDAAEHESSAGGAAGVTAPPSSGAHDPDACILDTGHFIDGDEEGYGIVCINDRHADRECPGERDIVREPKNSAGSDDR